MKMLITAQVPFRLIRAPVLGKEVGMTGGCSQAQEKCMKRGGNTPEAST